MRYIIALLLLTNFPAYAKGHAIIGYNSPVGQYQFYGSLSNSITGIIVTTAIASAVINSVEKDHTPTTESSGEIYTKKLMHDDECNCFKLMSVQIQ